MSVVEATCHVLHSKLAGQAPFALATPSADLHLAVSSVSPQGVMYGVFGLGNKQYEHFAAVGKRMHKALASLGGTPVCRRGDGDDDEDIDADFDAWQADLLAGLDVSPLVSVPKVWSRAFGI